MLRTLEDARLHFWRCRNAAGRGRAAKLRATFFGRLERPRPTSSSKRARPSHILMRAFIARPSIERRHARQRIAKKPSGQIARLELGAAIAIRQRQRTRPNARRERKVSGLAAASDVITTLAIVISPVRPPQ